MTNYAAAFYKDNTVEAAVEAIANNVDLIVVSDGRGGWLVIQGAST